MPVKLTSRHYRRSPLVQGEMKIACTVFFRMPLTLKNAQLVDVQTNKQRPVPNKSKRNNQPKWPNREKIKTKYYQYRLNLLGHLLNI